MSEKDRAPVARTVLQQCLQARLQVKPAEEHSEAQFVQVRTGDRVIVCPSAASEALRLDMVQDVVAECFTENVFILTCDALQLCSM